jgi:hypothetical protein
MGHLARPEPDSCLVSGQPVPPCLTCEVGFFRVGSDFFGFGPGFLGWIGFWVNNHGSYPARELLWVKNYGTCPSVALVELGRAEFFRAGQVAHDQVYFGQLPT